METAVYLMAFGIICVLICIAIDISKMMDAVKRYGRKENTDDQKGARKNRIGEFWVHS